MSTQKKGRAGLPKKSGQATTGQSNNLSQVNLPAEGEIVKVILAGILSMDVDKALSIFTLDFIGHNKLWKERITGLVKTGLRKLERENWEGLEEYFG
jgi:hypothetical protein